MSVADGEKTLERLRARYGDAVLSTGSFRGQHWVELEPGRYLEVCRWLRDDPACAYDVCLDVTALHWPHDPKPIEVVANLQSRSRNDRLRVRIRLSEGERAPSLASLWRSAEWNERETYDMFGVLFEGHPDLRRILMPEDYTDFPLRKEFPLYRG